MNGLPRAPSVSCGTIDPLLEATEADDVSAGFDADAHLVAIVGAGEHQAVDAGADQAAQDRARLGNRFQ